jgi:type IV secretory pathway VirJ component
LRNLAASNDGCHYVVAEIEDMSERLQRDLHFAGYHSPILAGIGAGGTLAYAALAQSPAVTIDGAISVDMAAALGTKVPLCQGAPAEAAEGGGFSYGAQPTLTGWWHVSAAAPLSPALAAVVERSRGAVPDARGDPLERLFALVRSALPSPTPAALPGALADLPLTELPALRPGPAMAVIYSGDGGWRYIDKQIAGVLAQKGMPVVGVDSLRYFWRAKTPEQMAADLSAIFAACRASWGDVRFILVGYSFGAGVLPFAVNRLPAADRARVVEVSLLGLEAHAPFEIEVRGWLQQPPSESAPAVRPEIERLDPALVQCFYGEQETDSLCRDPIFARVEVIHTSGGHHFDGDYAGLADRILAGARRRLAARAGQRPTTPETPPAINAAMSVSTKGSASPRGDAR